MDGIKNEDKYVEGAKELFAKTLEYYSTPYDVGEDDVDFANGDTQWPEAEQRSRINDNRPFLTENRCMPFIEQVVNSAREMRPRVRVSPVDDKGDVDTAEVFKGLVRNIERQSKASVAYDMAVQNAVTSGYGWIRINTAYTDPLSFDQTIQVESVPDWKSCLLDPASEMIDGSDAGFGFIYKDIEKDTFEVDYPDHEPLSFEGTEAADEDKVRIVEHFYKEYETTKIHLCFMIDGETIALTDDQLKIAQEKGAVAKVLQERETKLPTVKWCKLYGGGVLSETTWLGEYIPLVPVYGKLIWRKDRLESYSLIRNAKDPQRALNMIITTIAEITGSQPKNQPWVGAVGSFNSDDSWGTANTENHATLEYDPIITTDEVSGQPIPAPPPSKAQPLHVDASLFQIRQNASMGINAALGMYEENRGDSSNAISGVAIKARQLKGDKATYHFIDNLACSIRHVGVILIDLIPRIMNRKQIARIIGSDDKEKTVTLDPDAQTDEAAGVFNLNAGKYDVDVDVGPSYATQQQEFLDIMTTLLNVQPELANIAGDKIVEAAGGPYADVISKRIASSMPAEYQTDDPMAMKLMEAMKQLDAAKQQEDMLMAALEDKKKNEQAELGIKQGELQVKQSEAQTERLMTQAKILEMELKSKGAESEALSDITEAIMDIEQFLRAQSERTQEHNEVLDALISAKEQATTELEGIPAA